jgi:hypothetical protein
MFAGSGRKNRLPHLQDQLRRAQVVTADLMSKVVADGCTRVTMLSAGKARIDRLIESEAWTEAALALVELELPHWGLHRLMYEDDVWLCSLSKQWNLGGVGLSDCAESRHQSLPLAILSAMLEARQCNEATSEPSSMRAASSVLQCGAESSFPVETMCVDNFA